MQLRPIVKAAFKVDELVHQFQEVDVPDGHLDTGSEAEVNEKFDDAYLIGEAKNRLLLVRDQLDAIDWDDLHSIDWKIFSRDEKQLTNFIKRFKEKSK